MRIIEAKLDFEMHQLTVRLDSELNVQLAYERIYRDQVSSSSVTVEDITPAIRALWKHGSKIDAIKLYRTVTGGAYLRDAKEAVEKIVGEKPGW